ncbi:hypothetical protein F5H01DRAFT_333244, partial [Linnemannia elongata]
MNSSDISILLLGLFLLLFFQSPFKKTVRQSLFHTFSLSSPFLYASLFFTCSPTVICLQV